MDVLMEYSQYIEFSANITMMGIIYYLLYLLTIAAYY